MRMVQGVLFTAVLGGAMAVRAQGEQPALQGLPQYGVTLTGTPENPIIENHSGKVVIGFDVKLADANGRGPVLNQAMANSLLPEGIPDGGSVYAKGPVPINTTVPMWYQAEVWSAATLRSVIFADGQFVGADEQRSFAQFTTKLKAIIEVGMLAKTQAWDQVEALAPAFAQRPQAPPASIPPPSIAPPTSVLPPRSPEDQVEALAQALTQRLQTLPPSLPPRSVEERILTYFRQLAAMRLMQTRKYQGEAAADQLAQIYISLPTVWK